MTRLSTTSKQFSTFLMPDPLVAVLSPFCHPSVTPFCHPSVTPFCHTLQSPFWHPSGTLLSHPSVTLLSPFCHPSGTLLSPFCHPSGTLLSHPSVTLLSPFCLKCITEIKITNTEFKTENEFEFGTNPWMYIKCNRCIFNRRENDIYLQTLSIH